MYFYLLCLKALHAIVVQLWNLVKVEETLLSTTVGGGVPQSRTKLLKSYPGIVKNYQYWQSAMYIQLFKAMKSVYVKKSPCMLPLWSCDNIKKPSPNKGVCVGYVKVKFEFSACYFYRAIANQECNSCLSAHVNRNFMNSQKIVLTDS